MVSKAPVLAVVIAAILVVSGAYYFYSTSAASQGSVTINIIVTNGTTKNGQADTYSPRNFTVTLDQHVTILFDNTDDDPHELTIPAFNVNSGVVQGGSSVRITFTPNKAGTFEMTEPPGVCSLPGGQCTGAQEMTGNMTVLAP